VFHDIPNSFLGTKGQPEPPPSGVVRISADSDAHLWHLRAFKQGSWPITVGWQRGHPGEPFPCRAVESMLVEQGCAYTNVRDPS